MFNFSVICMYEHKELILIFLTQDISDKFLKVHSLAAPPHPLGLLCLEPSVPLGKLMNAFQPSS